MLILHEAENLFSPPPQLGVLTLLNLFDTQLFIVLTSGGAGKGYEDLNPQNSHRFALIGSLRLDMHSHIFILLEYYNDRAVMNIQMRVGELV